ncbi:MAG: heparinase II/III family protein [Gemmatimonadota bacterium]
MTVLLGADALVARRTVSHGALAPLAQSLRGDLTKLLDAGTPWIPPEKARMTRNGGRCPAHGVLLEFDPWSPHAHRCPECGTVYREPEHYRWWIMNYQLWLAERAVHAATLSVLQDDDACGRLAAGILAGYAEQYDRYPNRDNVLGPTRPFFSTYLEAIWLLPLTAALDLLEARDGRTALGDVVRERLVRPSAALIASYDEGRSNRQVYNNAAMAAAGMLLGDPALVEHALRGPSGLEAHLTDALLADGTWYEGENYHLFAHRGLWYGVTIAEAYGCRLPAEGVRRFTEAFATPFATALPDFTFPSRRDSQYRVSLRQWRIAESCELGLARADDPRLSSALATLYADEAAESDSGRARSTAEAERNVGPARLSRASLGWKSLLFARAELPPLEARRPASVHLAGQGLAVLRRDDARAYVALDYGESGGGHGHPDRLNAWLVVGNARILEDVGTGSYVDPTLHWYRSTLAHNAPLADGRSQWRADGVLLEFDERPEDGAGLVTARASIAPGVTVERSLVVMGDYVLDQVRWSAQRLITFDLPYHLDADFSSAGRWAPASLVGGRGLEDGFDFVGASEHVPGVAGLSFHAVVGDVPVRGWVDCDTPHEWWRCTAPGPPGEGRRRFLLLRARARTGRIRSVWSWGGAVTLCSFDPDRTVVQRGVWERHEHQRVAGAWHVTRFRRTQESTVVLGGSGDVDEPRALMEQSTWSGARKAGERGAGGPAVPAATDRPPLVLGTVTQVSPEPGALAGRPLPGRPSTEGAGAATGIRRFFLGEAHYRRSEATWREAGTPVATVGVAATSDTVVVEVAVVALTPVFAPPRDENPLDNEHPDTNSDGVQLYVGASRGAGRYFAWILVPEPTTGGVRITPRAAFGAPLPLNATSCLTADGWVLRVTLSRQALLIGGVGDFTLDLIVNEISPDRERRRGQLVLSGGHGEWIYLRGDRQDAARALTFHLSND